MEKIGNVSKARAAGNVNGVNKLVIFIPCCHVIQITGESGDYSGGTTREAYLLESSINYIKYVLRSPTKRRGSKPKCL